MTLPEKIRLMELLDRAENLASKFTGGYSGDFLSAEAFLQAMQDSIHKLKQGDKSQLQRLYLWFLPTSCWDDFVGSEGRDLANEITLMLSNAIVSS